MNEFNKYCCLLMHILKKVYDIRVNKKIILYDFFQKPFYLDI